MKIVLLGANGQVGSEIAKALTGPSFQLTALTRKECDLNNLEMIESVLDAYEADIIINATAYTQVDRAEEEAEQAAIVNMKALEKIALFCRKKDIPLIHFSTDYVFDGNKLGPYQEDDSPAPMNVYGKTKWEGELVLSSLLKKYIILRVSWVFGLQGKNFVKTILELAKKREEISVVNDQWGCPTASEDIARVVKAVIVTLKDPSFDAWGIFHYTSKPQTTWYGFSNHILSLVPSMGFPNKLKKIIPITTEDFPTKAHRPKNSTLLTSKIEETFKIQIHSWLDYLPEIIKGEMSNVRK